MSTALARTTTSALAHPSAGQTARDEFTDLVATCTELVRTGFLPEQIKTGAQAAAIVLAGRELGMPMMRSLRSLGLFKGNVIEDADSQLARFKTDGGKSKFTTLSATEATLWLRHPNGDEHTESFTMKDAQAAGLIGGAQMYSKYPKAMLRSRAITAGLKSLGWEGGCSTYAPGEIPNTDRPALVQSTAVQVPDAAPSPRREWPKAGELSTDAPVAPREPPPKSVDEVCDWIASAPKAPASESDETPTLADVAAWVKEHRASYSDLEYAALKDAYRARLETVE